MTNEATVEGLTEAARSGRDLTEAKASACLRAILEGGVPDRDIADLLIALSEKGETADEIVGFCRVLEDNAVNLRLPTECIDVCGTGGSGLNRFNVSTAVAFVLASDGIRVAKHGNRGSRRPNGSFDLLDALDCPFEIPVDQIEILFEETGLCFLYARQFHPLMKAVVGARRLADRRTIFNMAAPLCNPARPACQVVGTPTRDNAEVLAETLRRLGRQRSIVVSGAPGVDEVSVSGETALLDISQDALSQMSLSPSDLGIEPIEYTSIPGGDAEVNATIFYSLFETGEPVSIAQLVSASAGVAMYCADHVRSIEEGYTRSYGLLKDGSAFRKFQDFRGISCKLAN